MNYLIYGNSFNLIDDEIKLIVKEHNYEVFHMSEMSLSDVIESMSYGDLFSEKKIVVIKEFELVFDNKKYKDELEQLLDILNISENSIIIFVSSVKLKNSNKWNKDFLEKVKVIETFMGTKPYEIVNYFKTFFKNQKISINEDVINKFISKCANNVDIIISEFKKLKLYGITNKITNQDVEQLVSNYNTKDIFELKDAILNKNISKSIKMLDDLENSKMEVLPIIVMLAKEYIMTYNIKRLALEKKSNEEIGNTLFGMHPYRVKILRDIGQKYNLEELEQIILYLCNIDQKIVSEDNLGYDEIKIFIINFLMK